MSNKISSKSFCERNNISMSEKYKEYCMKFSNEELRKYMLEYLINNSWDNKLIRFLSENGDEIAIDSSEKIGTIVFDGFEENLFINFYGIHTSILVYDIEIMFIDEASKGIYSSSDVYDNAVYEGDLRELSHEEMLKMFSEIILCFQSAEDVSMIQSDVQENKYKKYNYYEPHMFIIKVKNSNTMERTCIYENITIKY